METHTGFADVNGTRLYYEISGRGEPLVLIHGVTLDHRMWSPQLGHLTRSFRVLRYDVRGFGRSEVCGLRWEWEVEVPELETKVFLIPGDRVKNGADRLVVLNSVARSVIEGQRGLHSEFVFVYSQIRKNGKQPQYKPIETMNNT